MRRRISWLAFVTTSAVVASFVIPLCLLVQTLAADRAMAAADQEARNVAILVSGLHGGTQLARLVAGIDARGRSVTSVLTVSGRQLGGGPPMATDPDVVRALTGEAFTRRDAQGGRILLPIVLPGGTAVVRTSVSAADLRGGVVRAWLGIVGLGVVLLAAALAIASRLGRRISEPLLEVSGVAHRLREGELSARAQVRGTEETQELARALNGLAARTEELLASERQTVGDLSHRLRTPVTALRLDAEGVSDPGLAARLQGHISTLQRTIDAIVRDARRPVRSDLAERCDITRTVRERLGFWRPLAEDQDRPMQVHVPDHPLMVTVGADDLVDLVDVLVDNVFAHTPEGTPLSIDVVAGPRTVTMVVTDAGPGFTLGGRPERHSERQGSTGLGLDIARRTALACGGELRTAASPQGGALVEVTLPRSDDGG